VSTCSQGIRSAGADFGQTNRILTQAWYCGYFNNNLKSAYEAALYNVREWKPAQEHNRAFGSPTLASALYLRHMA
jgi:hypothetical protein